MFSAILILLVMPFTDLSRSRGIQFRPLSKIAFYIFIANFLVLMQLGAKHVESPFIEFGQISTIIYFSYFLVIVPVISLLENCLIGYNNLDFSFLENGIGLFGGLFHATCITNVFHIFILLLSSIILVLTAFYPRNLKTQEYSSLYKLIYCKLIYYETSILNKMAEQYKIIEYPLILLFIVTGALFLMSTNDLVSIFLSIELQSYGLYLLSTIYRNSESATSGGLMYFLLGGLSSCFILLSTSLLYANSGTTNLDSLYIIINISDMDVSMIDKSTNILY